jgi:AraC-like DNA-binding protein
MPAWDDIPLGDPRHPDRIVFASPLVTVGTFRCRVEHPMFEDSGPIRQSCVVFPRSSVAIEHRGCAPFVTDATMATCYHAGDRYRRLAVSAEGDRCDWFAVAGSHVTFRATHVPVDAPLFHAQRRLLRRLEHAAAIDALQVEETVAGLVTAVAGVGAGAREDGLCDRAAGDLVARVQRLLATRFKEPLSLHAIAAAIGCSPFHLCRVFRRATGTTLHAHRTALRLRAALEAIEGGARIVDVALDAGFSSHSHFTSAFQRAFGVAPSGFGRGKISIARPGLRS